MLKESKNKMITGNEENVQNKAVAPKTEHYLFPEHGVTVEASSLEEAHEKLEAIIKKKK